MRPFPVVCPLPHTPQAAAAAAAALQKLDLMPLLLMRCLRQQQHAHSFPRVAALPLPSKTHIYARSPHPVPRSITYGQRHQRSPARARHQRRRHVLSHSRRFKSHATHPLCMCVWSFPKSSPSEEAKMLTRSGLHSASPQSCQLFYRVGKDWAYSCTVSDGGGEGGQGWGVRLLVVVDDVGRLM